MKPFAYSLGELRNAIVAYSGSVFAAGFNQAAGQVVIHTCNRGFLKTAVSDLAASVRAQVPTLRVVVKTHDVRAIAKPRSLESWVSSFKGQEILFDPTAVCSRASMLVDGVRIMRAEFAGEVTGYYLDARARILLVLAPNAATGAGSSLAQRVSERWSSLDQVHRSADGQFELRSVTPRVVDTLPDRELVPVDKKSIRGMPRSMSRLAQSFIASIIASGLAMGTAVAHTPASFADQANKFGALGSLSVFSDGAVGSSTEAFASAGLDLYFGATSITTKIEVQVAQAGSGLKIVVTPEPRVDDKAELNRPSWATPHTAGAGPGS